MDLLDPKNLPAVDATKVSIDTRFIEEKYEKAKALHAKAIERNNEKLKKDVDNTFVQNMMRDGTLVDKISAATMMVQRSPLHNIATLRDTLINNMAMKKSKREALMASDSIRDLFMNVLIPNNRKLKYFRDQPLAAEGVLARHLVIWYYEDELKKTYFSFIQVLEMLAKDALTFVRTKATQLIYDLLTAKPEQEQNLLTLLVNKIGDQEKKISSKVVHLLSQILVKHPAMKATVVHYVEQFVFKPNVTIKAQYYAITFLNQIVLSTREGDVEVANKLIGTYFLLFDKFVGDKKSYLGVVSNRKSLPDPKKKKDKKKRQMKMKKIKERNNNKQPLTDKPVNGELSKAEQLAAVDSKIMAALLIGVTRAFPYAKLSKEVFDDHLDTLYRISHYGAFTVLVQSLTLIFQIQTAGDSNMDRFYRSLYDSLLDTRLMDSSRQSMYLNLLFRALKVDYSATRIMAFAKRILQVCTLAEPHLVCGALFVISEVAKLKPELWTLFTRKEIAFVATATESGKTATDEAYDSDDDVEVFKDVDTDSEDATSEEEEKKKTTTEESKETEKKMDVDKKHAGLQNKNNPYVTPCGYDFMKREPLYANANVSCAWELLVFERHFHPTVSLYAKTLRSRKPIEVPQSEGYDPLQNHTLARFLDRFVIKNPKKAHSANKGSSYMQPQAAGSLDSNHVISANSKAARVKIIKDTTIST